MDLIDNYNSDNDVFLPESDSAYSGSDIEVWNPTVPARTVSVSDDGNNDDYIDTNKENYKEVLSPEQYVPCIFSLSGSCWTEPLATFLIASSHLFLYVFGDYSFVVVTEPNKPANKYF